jgi:sugar/nucleoside kinase (ribokinase family)
MPAMRPAERAELPDYLILGHVSRDLTPDGAVLGGTVAYAGLTANRLGRRVAAVTACGPDLDLAPLAPLSLRLLPSAESTSFENRYTAQRREQWLRAVAVPVDEAAVPDEWRASPIVHLGPIAQEVSPQAVPRFPESFVGLTPQGWLREWDAGGRVRPKGWRGLEAAFGAADAVVLSLEDLAGRDEVAEEMAEACQVLALTEGARGARVYWKGIERSLPGPQVEEVDPTGAGDIFAAVFFVHFAHTRDAWQAAEFANLLAGRSVTRPGLTAIPTPEEIAAARLEESR